MAVGLLLLSGSCARAGDQLPGPGRRFDPVGAFWWIDPRIDVPPVCQVKITIRGERLFGWISEETHEIERCSMRDFQLDRIRFDGKRLEFEVVCPGFACPQAAQLRRIIAVVTFASDNLAEGYVLVGNTNQRSALRRFPLRLERVKWEF